MNRKLLWIAVPVVIIVALVGAGSLLASSQKNAPEVVEPVAGEAYFPTGALTDEQGAVSVEAPSLT